jgi:GTP-binding protein
MNIVTATYTGSYVDLEKCPPPTRPEYAFIGRSNVGKSSLINLLTGRKALAKTSGTPGKTKTLNFFSIDDAWNIVDLPGYGFAKTALKQRRQWEQMIETYVRKRTNLLWLFVLIDSRLPPQKIDLEFVDQLGAWEVPFILVFTKTDKSSQRDVSHHIKAFTDDMKQRWESVPPVYKTSTVKRTGRDGILELIAEYNIRFGALAGK